MPLDITNIKHRDLFDKLRVFQLAGEESQSGWDYAIPQACFDELLKMGIQDAGRWFVMDCQSQPWRLRHIGEAVFTILHARSEANKEIFLATIHNNEILARVLQSSVGEGVNSEADAGLIDLNVVIGIIAEAYSLGRKDMKDAWTESITSKALVNENNEKQDSCTHPNAQWSGYAGKKCPDCGKYWED